MNIHIPLTRDLVLIGGGHTHALVLRKWGMNPLPGVRVTLINPGPTAPYSGMLPGFVAGHYSRDELDIDLVKLCRFAGARLVSGAADRIDRVAQTVNVPGQPPIGYDLLSVDIGITSAMPDLPGFAEHAVPAKPLGTFATRWATFLAQTSEPCVAILGGGVAGAELAMAMAHALRQIAKSPAIQLIDRGAILKDLGGTARDKMLAALAAQGVIPIANAEVVAIDADGVLLADGRRINANFITGAAGARPHGWIGDTGLGLTDGFINVDGTLQSSDPAIFAVGDCAHLTASPRPKAGVFAVREAPVLLDNLRAILSGGALRSYTPQRDYLKLISQGGKVALAEKFGTALQGPLLWRWKDHIDRKFMRQFDDLPNMDMPDLPLTVADGVVDALGDKPMCGGCGAKVGRGALRDVLAAHPPPPRDDVRSVAGDDAAVLLTGGATQVMSTDHLRSFTHDHVMMTRVAALHALGDIWAMGATPQAATISLILPRMSPDLQRRTLGDIMAAAQAVMGDAGAAIVGGHTSLGDEFTIGFTLTGLCDHAPITLTGAQPGDLLILTKPIGSGVMLAAEMAGQARGADVLACYDAMTQAQGAAAPILSAAHAMTDVTGFGLAGHLAGICAASGVGAEVTLDAVPMMQGALALSAAGVQSTLYPDNRSGAGSVFGAEGAAGALLFDPQTAGGLLAAVAANGAADIVAALQDAGYPAVVIGRIVAGDPVITVQ